MFVIAMLPRFFKSYLFPDPENDQNRRWKNHELQVADERIVELYFDCR